MDKLVSMRMRGNFYDCYGDGAVILHVLKGYKFNYFSRKVGFPTKIIDEITSTLEENNVSYEVLKKDEVIKSFKGSDKVFDEILEKGLKDLSKEERVNRLMDKINKMDSEQLEKVIELLESIDE